MFYGYSRPKMAQSTVSSVRVGDKDSFEARIEVKKLSYDVERLLMITEALWEMLKAEGKYTDDDLVAKITEIDMRDGKLDGRVGTKSGPKQCTQCGRTLMRDRPQCMYCGATPSQAEDPFER